MFLQVASQVLTDQTCQLMETLITSLGEGLLQLNVTNAAYKLNGDLRALSLVYSAELPVVPPPELAPVLTKLLEKIKQEAGQYLFLIST